MRGDAVGQVRQLRDEARVSWYEAVCAPPEHMDLPVVTQRFTGPDAREAAEAVARFENQDSTCSFRHLARQLTREDDGSRTAPHGDPLTAVVQ